MRVRRKKLSVQMFSLRAFLVLVGCASLLAFIYLAFYEATSNAGAGKPFLGISVLNWLKPSPGDSQAGDTNILNKDFDFVIKVLAYDRLDSLKRCLKSLAVADYGGDNVNIDIFVDHFKTIGDAQRRLLHAVDNSQDYDFDGKNSTRNSTEEGVIKNVDEEAIEVEDLKLSTDPLERSLQQARYQLLYLDTFHWSHGKKQVHYRTQNVGLQGQWLEAWWPASEHQFALIVEDDMQVSPLYYRYVRSIIANYYYNSANFDASIFGITLQRPRFVPGKGGNRLVLNDSTRLFLYPLVGTWGQVLFPRPWKEFRLWVDEQKAKGIEPIIEGMVTTDWYKRLGSKIWTPWFIKFAHSRDYYNIYTNFLKDRALSVSHRAGGVNYRADAGPDSKLIKRRGVTDINLWEMPPMSTLKWYDFCFHEVYRNRLLNGSEGVANLVSSIQVDQEILLVNCIGIEEAILRNWLCQLTGLGRTNYLLLENDFNISTELSRRGHPVVLVRDNEETDDPYGFQRSIRTIQQIISTGCSLWFARPDLVWLNSPLQSADINRQDMVATTVDDVYHSGLFFLRSTSKSKAFLEQMDTIATENRGWNGLGKAMWLASPETLEIGSLNAIVGSGNLTVDAAQPQLLERLEEQPQELMEKLKAAGLWLVDAELACTRVSCRKKFGV